MVSFFKTPKLVWRRGGEGVREVYHCLKSRVSYPASLSALRVNNRYSYAFLPHRLRIMSLFFCLLLIFFFFSLFWSDEYLRLWCTRTRLKYRFPSERTNLRSWHRLCWKDADVVLSLRYP